MYFMKEEKSNQYKSLNFSLTESLLQMSSSLFTIANLSPDQFSDSNDDIFYYMYNCFNNLHLAVVNSSEMYIKSLHESTKVEEGYYMNRIIFYSTMACLFFSIVALTPVIQIVAKNKKEFLEIFLEIDNNNLRRLTTKCEKFMNQLQDEGN